MTFEFGDLSGKILSMGQGFNDSSIQCPEIFCNYFDEIGPPPDWLPPPPPLPPFMFQFLTENDSIPGQPETDGCNLCHTFGNLKDSESIQLPQPDHNVTGSSFSLLFGSILGSVILCIILLFILIKWRRWKLLPSSVFGLDSCSIFTESIMKKQKDVTSPCSSPENCLSPVVNEKSPQSIITSCSTKTSIPNKYWRCRDETSGLHHEMVGQRRSDIVEYTNLPYGSSCTSSPVYDELDTNGVAINRSQIPATLLIRDPSNPYTTHIYSEVADAMRIAAHLGTPTTLLPSESINANYDYVAYLTNNDNYNDQVRSYTRRQRPGLTNIASAVPLLPTQSNYLTTDQSTRIDLHSQNQQSEMMPRYIGFRQHNPANIHDLLANSTSSLSNYQVPYSPDSKDNPKRPLPAVPGVRL